MTASLHRESLGWESNPRDPAYEAGAKPLSYRARCLLFSSDQAAPKGQQTGVTPEKTWWPSRYRLDEPVQDHWRLPFATSVTPADRSHVRLWDAWGSNPEQKVKSLLRFQLRQHPVCCEPRSDTPGTGVRLPYREPVPEARRTSASAALVLEVGPPGRTLIHSSETRGRT